ncbi:DUF6090 family protein [Robiginitalea sp. IMCC43444]|uniref:DUF6090 family protein n=1 Tax=Robiginitalea sp. IMCC43444 TaxID=3459121 RepID=UPI0040417C76
MFRFFRQLRQHLLTENKLSKYLLYAIGEILLVVVGILLALQINTWNEGRISKIDEQKYLKRLKQDLLRDVERLEEIRSNYETRLFTGLSLLDSLGKNNGSIIRKWDYFKPAVKNYQLNHFPDTLSMGRKFFRVLAIDHFSPTDITFQELLSTGKINILTDDSLKTALQYHYPYLKETDRFQSVIVMEVQKNYRAAMFNNHISSYSNDQLEDIKKKLVSPDQLITATENYLKLTTSMLETLYYEPNSVYSKTTDLLYQIENNIALNYRHH